MASQLLTRYIFASIWVRILLFIIFYFIVRSAHFMDLDFGVAECMNYSKGSDIARNLRRAVEIAKITENNDGSKNPEVPVLSTTGLAPQAPGTMRIASQTQPIPIPKAFFQKPEVSNIFPPIVAEAKSSLTRSIINREISAFVGSSETIEAQKAVIEEQQNALTEYKKELAFTKDMLNLIVGDSRVSDTISDRGLQPYLNEICKEHGKPLWYPWIDDPDQC